MNSLYEQLVDLWPALGGMPPWTLYLFLALMLLGVLLLIRAGLARQKRDNPYVLYKQDRVFDVDWTWKYRKKVPFDITFHCPSCHNALFYDEHRSGGAEGVETSLECETCDRTLTTIEGPYATLLKRVQGHIERKIASGRWREGPGGEGGAS